MSASQQSTSKRDLVFKWGGSTLFIAVILAAIGLIAYAGRESQTMEGGGTAVITSNPAQQDSAFGTSAPVSVQGANDLKDAELSLDSTDLTSFDATLAANDSDLDSF